MTKVPPVVRELGKELYDMRKVGLIASFAFLSKPEMRRLREWSGQDNPNAGVELWWPVGRGHKERQHVGYFEA